MKWLRETQDLSLPLEESIEAGVDGLLSSLPFDGLRTSLASATAIVCERADFAIGLPGGGILR